MKHFACVVLLLAATGAAADQPELAGVGARPLTDALASTWFIRSVDSARDEYEMALVVFLAGEPGWVREKAEWTWRAEPPAYSQFVIRGVALRVELSAGRVKILGYDAPLTDGNVLVVTTTGVSAARRRCASPAIERQWRLRIGSAPSAPIASSAATDGSGTVVSRPMPS